MEIRLLKYFITIAEEGTVSQAAQVLHITQPTLSRQLKELETDLDTQLFTRQKNRLHLTEAGLFLKSRAEEILELTDQTQQEFIDRKKQLFSGHIALGCVEADNSDTLSLILEEFIADYPEVTFSIYTETSDDIVERLDKGLIDLAVLLEPINTAKYHKIVLPRTERWGLLVSSESFLAESDVVQPVDLIGTPLLVSGRPDVQQLVADWVGRPLANLNIIGNYNLSFNIISLVQRQVGSAVCIEGAPQYGTGTKFIPFAPAVQTNCVLAWRRERETSPVVREFIHYFRRAFEN
ncbi:LysR family transcriptional regulator [Loigolactobacillus zhaoyuanensis]|uniref:LysR family transcriptional regulator n=1 Tax=Loigolactobacillus zhaoyuanensis TaxID=2486017 RepID=A0ABW8U8M0_9LACO|nr:LysR family transcriptional regulator [Loigolactobacillus zhaoyuanensis]